ncbi:MAG: hypothetical protein C0469_06215 [Cyanobacteria bacterium DS2.3.42]|nr:hypothetical protein [Cyanobacteria bacterium DS2.3.42]
MHLTILSRKVSILSFYLERQEVAKHSDQEQCINADEYHLLFHIDLFSALPGLPIVSKSLRPKFCSFGSLNDANTSLI